MQQCSVGHRTPGRLIPGYGCPDVEPYDRLLAVGCLLVTDDRTSTNLSIDEQSNTCPNSWSIYGFNYFFQFVYFLIANQSFKKKINRVQVMLISNSSKRSRSTAQLSVVAPLVFCSVLPEVLFRIDQPRGNDNTVSAANSWSGFAEKRIVKNTYIY